MLSAAVIVAAVVGSAEATPDADALEIRHFEPVSPADKGRGDIVGDGETTLAARLGDAVAFSSRTPFGDEVGSGASGQTQYVARRSADGWVVHSITPTPQPFVTQIIYGPTRLQTYSDDLRTAVVWAYDLPDVAGDTPDRNNIYLEDTATRMLQPVTVSQADPLEPSAFGTMFDWGVSADAKHLAFVSPTRLLPDAAPGVPNVYQWDGGTLSLAGILPDGTVPASGSDVMPRDYRGAMSADGARLVFTATPGSDPQLYMRIDESRTVRISEPEGSDASQPAGVSLQAVTPDGRNVFFVTTSRLLDSDTNSGPDLYRWADSADPAHDANLTQISTNGDVPGELSGGSVIGVSEDGQRVYYQTAGEQVIVWDHGSSKLVRSDVRRDPNAGTSLAATASAPGVGRVTPDGMWLAFVTRSMVDSFHGLTGNVTKGHYEMYVYSLRDDRLTCVSCPSGSARSDVSVIPAATSGIPQIRDDAIRPRFLADGGQVFFSTAEALVPEDVNGVADTYEYDPTSGSLGLVSTGTGADAATFADASANGSDVFLVTRQRLACTDQDDLVDLYDARVGVDPPASCAGPPRTCVGDECQPPPSPDPSAAPLGSLSSQTSGRAAISVARRTTVRGAIARVRVTLSTGGVLAWRGNGVRSGFVKRSRGGRYVLVLRLDRPARARLKRKRRYATLIRLTFVPADGATVGATVGVTFRGVARKGR